LAVFLAGDFEVDLLTGFLAGDLDFETFLALLLLLAGVLDFAASGAFAGVLTAAFAGILTTGLDGVSKTAFAGL